MEMCISNRKIYLGSLGKIEQQRNDFKEGMKWEDFQIVLWKRHGTVLVEDVNVVEKVMDILMADVLRHL